MVQTGKSHPKGRVAFTSALRFCFRVVRSRLPMKDDGLHMSRSWRGGTYRPITENKRTGSEREPHSQFSLLTFFFFTKQNCIDKIETIISVKLQLVGIVGIGIAGLTVRKPQKFFPCLLRSFRTLHLISLHIGDGSILSENFQNGKKKNFVSSTSPKNRANYIHQKQCCKI